MRRKSIFTPTEREFLKNPSNYTKNVAKSHRYNIRGAVEEAIKDLTYAAEILSKKELKRVFTAETFSPFIDAILKDNEKVDIQDRRPQIALLLCTKSLEKIESVIEYNPIVRRELGLVRDWLRYLRYISRKE